MFKNLSSVDLYRNIALHFHAGAKLCSLAFTAEHCLLHKTQRYMYIHEMPSIKLLVFTSLYNIMSCAYSIECMHLENVLEEIPVFTPESLVCVAISRY